MSHTPFRKTRLGMKWKLVGQKYHRARRELYQRLFCDRSQEKRILLIVGCQRSGTTMLGEVLAKDLRTAVLQEQSCITAEQTLRLKPYAEANRLLHQLRAPFVIAKPLVETQWTRELLRDIKGSKALWMYRHFQDVVRSNVKRFHSQIEGLKSAVTGDPPTWRSERLSTDTRELLGRYFREDMRREDAAALGWYARNVLFFELGLDARDDVMLCKYENLVSVPDSEIARIYRFVGLPLPARSITNNIDQGSIGLGNKVEIAPGIRQLCEDLLNRLEEQYAASVNSAGVSAAAVEVNV